MVAKAFLYEKVKTMGFSKKNIAACDLKAAVVDADN